jgi:hypothetical protein
MVGNEAKLHGGSNALEVRPPPSEIPSANEAPCHMCILGIVHSTWSELVQRCGSSSWPGTGNFQRQGFNGLEAVTFRLDYNASGIHHRNRLKPNYADP